MKYFKGWVLFAIVIVVNAALTSAQEKLDDDKKPDEAQDKKFDFAPMMGRKKRQDAAAATPDPVTSAIDQFAGIAKELYENGKSAMGNVKSSRKRRQADEEESTTAASSNPGSDFAAKFGRKRRQADEEEATTAASSNPGSDFAAKFGRKKRQDQAPGAAATPDPITSAIDQFAGIAKNLYENGKSAMGNMKPSRKRRQADEEKPEDGEATTEARFPRTKMWKREAEDEEPIAEDEEAATESNSDKGKGKCKGGHKGKGKKFGTYKKDKKDGDNKPEQESSGGMEEAVNKGKDLASKFVRKTRAVSPLPEEVPGNAEEADETEETSDETEKTSEEIEEEETDKDESNESSSSSSSEESKESDESKSEESSKESAEARKKRFVHYNIREVVEQKYTIV